MNQSCYALKSKTELSQHFLFFGVCESVTHMKSKAGGAVFDAIIVDTFKNIPFLIPNDELSSKFSDYAVDTLQQIDNLSHSNRELTKARDILLPRLMDGRVEV